jgi:hypothetical protein
VIGLSALPARAGWFSIKNETKTAVLIVEVPAHPTAKRGKPVRLLPGEVYREYHAAAGEKHLRVLDAKSPTQVLCDAKVKWPVEDVAVRVRTADKITKLEPVAGKAEAAVVAVAKRP